jgi:large subunit ribosomal protein L23
MSLSSLSMALQPRMSEKAYGLSKERQTYIFDVPMTANKVTVAAAVTAQFSVTVEEVNIAISKGKAKRTYTKKGRKSTGKDNDVKKAYVKLKVGDHIPVFAAVEEDEAKAEKATERAEKVAEKQAKKAGKAKKESK